MGDSDGRATFTYVGRELGKRGIAFLCAREKRQPDSKYQKPARIHIGLRLLDAPTRGPVARDAW